MGRRPAPGTRGARALTAFVDTNVPSAISRATRPSPAARATDALSSGEHLLLADLVLAECVYVIETFYEVERERVAALMRAAIAPPAIRVVHEASLLRALEVYELDRSDFVEAYLVAQAEATGVDGILSFDRSIDRVAGITRREP